MNNKSKSEAERRAKLLRSRALKLKQLEEQNNKTDDFAALQSRNFNSNFKKNAKNAAKSNGKAAKMPKKASGDKGKVNLSVSTRKGEVLRHQRMLSQDVNAQANQHIIGIPVNKSRYNGYKGEQVSNTKLRAAKMDENAVRVIPIGGLGEFGIGKNMTVIEYKDEAILIDMGTLFAGDDYPGVNYMIPDMKHLEKQMARVKAICFTHAHLDHIGACRHLLPKFDPLTPIYATAFTIGMIKKQMNELQDVPELNYQSVEPLEHRIYKVSENLSVEFIHTLHSIPGNTAIVVRTPNGPILVSGDWRFETKPMGTPTDYERLTEIAEKEGYALMINESTNIDSPGTHPHSEYDVGENLGKVMDNYATGRIIISCFSSQIARIELVLKEAAKRGRKVAFAGYSMINNVEVALRAKAIKVPKDVVVKMEDIVKLPDEKVTVVCTGSQGELNAVLNRMVSGSHRFIKIKATDTIIFSSNPIPGNEPHVVSTVDGLLREGAQVIQNGKTHITNIGPLHLSGHAYYDDHVKFVTDMHPKNYMPYHGEFFMLEHNAEMAENVVGIPRDNIIVADNGDVVELLPNQTIRKNGRVKVGNLLFDDADQAVNEAVVKDRIHISREGIFIVVLTVSKKTNRLVKTPDIISRAFIYLDNSEELIGKIRHYLRLKVDKALNTKSDPKVFKEEIRNDVTHILFDATGHTPIVIPVINKV